MKTYPAGLQRLLEQARKTESPCRAAPGFGDPGPVVAVPWGFAERVVARWLSVPAPFSADLERFARWAAAVAVTILMVVAVVRPAPRPIPVEPWDDFLVTPIPAPPSPLPPGQP